MYRKLSKEELFSKIESHPRLMACIEEMIRTLENPYDEIMMIDDAEEAVYKIVMETSKEILGEWIERRSTECHRHLEEQEIVVSKNQKKIFRGIAGLES